MNKTKRRKRNRGTKTTVCMTQDLRRRMDEFQSQYVVNWSRLAVDAWERYMSDKNKQENP